MKKTVVLVVCLIIVCGSSRAESFRCYEVLQTCYAFASGEAADEWSRALQAKDGQVLANLELSGQWSQYTEIRACTECSGHAIRSS